MLKRTLLSITALFLMGGCAKATLIDQTLNAFTASASEGFDDRITIKWITNAYYTSYQVIRSETENGTYIPVSTPIGAASFDDMTTPRGVPYYYKVRGFNNIGIPLFTTVKPARGVAGEAIFTPPTTLTVSQGESSARIFLRWERAKDAVKYIIYRESRDLVEGDYHYVEIGETAKTEYTDTLDHDGNPMGPGQTYYYKIIAVSSDEVVSESYPFTDRGLKGTTMGGSSGFTSDAGSNPDYIELTWNPVSSVKKYIIYRSTDRVTLGTVLDTMEAPAEAFAARAAAPLVYQDHSAEMGKVYYYTIFFQGSHDLMQIPGEKVKSYRKSASAPATPTGLTASRGEDPTFVKLTWDPVDGASMYEVSRSVNADGPWEELELTVNQETGTGKMYTKDNPYADSSVKSFSYYYRVTAGNPALGLPSAAQQGWANKPPVGITASKLFGGKIVLTWDAVPGATKYLVSYSETRDGIFASAGTVDRPTFTHQLPLVTEKEKSFYYKISADTPYGLSFASDPVEGKISKMVAPQNFKVRNNAAILPEGSSVVLSWDKIESARQYRVYRATLKHRFAEIENLKPTDYKLVASPSSANYQDPMSSYPLRRYVYKVVGVDFENAEGEAVYTSDVADTADKTVYRLPRDTMEFMKDIDKTIVEAQTRISGFGNMGSSGSPSGRAGGQYIYSAGTSAVNNWANFTSFEITMSGATSFSINMGNMTATQSGTVNISGLYSGSITYNSLVGALGGYTTGGTITVRYNGVTKTYDFTELDSLDNIVRTTEPKPSYPSYEEGGG